MQQAICPYLGLLVGRRQDHHPRYLHHHFHQDPDLDPVEQEAQTAAQMEVESLADRSVVDVAVLPHYSGQGLCLVPKDLAPLLLEHWEQLL